ATTSNPAIKADLGEIRSAGKRATRLTQQLLRLAGREALRAEPMDLAVVVAAMDGRLRSMLPPGVRLRVVIPGSLPAVRADPTMISEVLGVLVDNSAQATAGAGEIVIRATEVTVTPEVAAQQPDLSARPYVVMSVVDQGVGMDEKTRAGALEPFFTTRTEAGRGLGLPTAYGLVRQSGGALVIESAPRSGTTVRVYLPIVVEAAAANGSAFSIDQQLPLSARSAATAVRPPDMILVMDHDDVTRGDTANMLLRNQFDVVEARDGAEAVRLAVEEQHRIRLVIMDRVMGSMIDTGLPEMIKALLPDAKLILVSVFSRQMLASQGLDDPSVPFMTKDYSEAELVKRVREVLGPAPGPRGAWKRK
ncbi:MAG: ATP-binding protein, partial [Candidatus Dormibacteraeota bacterium]|nr:ATP-binding protein [Candidatus Dormibacteraeota bacterium]